MRYGRSTHQSSGAGLHFGKILGCISARYWFAFRQDTGLHFGKILVCISVQKEMRFRSLTRAAQEKALPIRIATASLIPVTWKSDPPGC